MNVSTLFTLLAAVCATVAVAELAGVWWALLLVAVVFAWIGWVAHQWEAAAPAAPPTIDEALDAMDRS